MVQEIQSMQKKMAELEVIMEEKEIDGISGGGMVTITVTGKSRVKRVKIDKSLANPDEVEMLEDLIIAAFNNARQNADECNGEEMAKLGISPNLLKGIT